MSTLEHFPSQYGLSIAQLRVAVDSGELHTITVCHHGIATSRVAAVLEYQDGYRAEFLEGGLMRLYRKDAELAVLQEVLIAAPMVYMLGVYYTDWMITFIQDITRMRRLQNKETGVLCDHTKDPRILPMHV